jgi:ribosomal peptide maturation radical SAM protein 1
MPWASITLPCLALSILKKCAARAGAQADVHYLNIRFGEQIGFALYEQIALKSALYPEWFFSVNLFGAGGQLANSLDDLEKNHAQVLEKLVKTTGGSVSECRKMADAADLLVKNALRDVDWSSYDVVGFTITHAQICSSLLMAKTIKQVNPQIVTLFGGSAAKSDMGLELLRAFSWVDYVVHGEAEEVFTTILQQVSQGARAAIPGVSVRVENDILAGRDDVVGIQDINNSPAPDHDDYFREVQRVHLDQVLPISITVESSRGCWWGAKHLCTFCGLNGTSLVYRSKDPDLFFNEVMELAERHQWLSFLSCDTILDMRYCRTLLPRFAAADIDLSFFYEVKPNFTKEQIKVLADSGTFRIQPGIEALDSDLLQLMKKGIAGYQNIQFLKWCAEYGIEAFWNILYGFPGEKPSHFQDYVRLMRLMFHLKPPIDVCPITFERFSPYDLEREKFGLKLRPVDTYDVLFPAGVQKEKIAYYFESTDQPVIDSMDYMHPIVETFREWRRVRSQHNIVCSYEKGPNFLILYDNRPLKPGSPVELRKIVLKDLPARVYLFCDEAHSWNAIAAEVLGAGTRSQNAERDLARLLERFVEHGLMLKEGDRYLSLAVRRNRKSAARTASAKKSIENAGMMEPETAGVFTN